MKLDKAIAILEDYVSINNKYPNYVYIYSSSISKEYSIPSLIYSIFREFSSNEYSYRHSSSIPSNINNYIEINNMKNEIKSDKLGFAKKIIASNLVEIKNSYLKKMITEDKMSKLVPSFKESDIAVQMFKQSIKKTINGTMAKRYINEVIASITSASYKQQYLDIILSNSKFTKDIFKYCINFQIKIPNYKTYYRLSSIDKTSIPIFTTSYVRQLLNNKKITYSAELESSYTEKHIESDLNPIKTDINFQFAITQDYLLAVDILINIENINSQNILDYRQWLVDNTIKRHKDINIWNAYNSVHIYQAIPSQEVIDEYAGNSKN